MFRLTTCLAVVLGLTGAAHAGALVSLVPWPPVNGVAYQPGEHSHVDLYVQMDSSSSESVRVRLLQFDLSDSSPELTLIPVQNHPLAEGGPIPFWNFTGAPACAADQSRCGNTHFIDGSLQISGPFSDDAGVFAIAYFGMNPSEDQIVLTQAARTLVGSVDVVLPPHAGEFVLDVLNADYADFSNQNFGTYLYYGFGLPSDPERVLLWSHTGGVVMAPDGAPGTDEFGRVAFIVIPEPASLMLLFVGGLTILMRRSSGLQHLS